MTIADLIQSVPSQAWIALFSVILASVITLFGVWLTNRASTQRLILELEHRQKVERESLIRERIEELYVISNKYLSSLCSYYFPYRQVMQGELTFNQALDITIESGNRRDFEPNRVTMLINMYFPEIKPHFSEIINLRETLNDIVQGYKHQYKNGDTDGTRWLEYLQPSLEKLATLCDNFENHVVELNAKCTTK